MFLTTVYGAFNSALKHPSENSKIPHITHTGATHNKVDSKIPEITDNSITNNKNELKITGKQTDTNIALVPTNDSDQDFFQKMLDYMELNNRKNKMLEKFTGRQEVDPLLALIEVFILGAALVALLFPATIITMVSILFFGGFFVIAGIAAFLLLFGFPDQGII